MPSCQSPDWWVTKGITPVAQWRVKQKLLPPWSPKVQEEKILWPGTHRVLVLQSQSVKKELKLKNILISGRCRESGRDCSIFLSFLTQVSGECFLLIKPNIKPQGKVVWVSQFTKVSPLKNKTGERRVALALWQMKSNLRSLQMM